MSVNVMSCFCHQPFVNSVCALECNVNIQIHCSLAFPTCCLILSLCVSSLLRLSKPFPIGDRVTFSGKDCVCQQCSHTLVKSNEPIKIHGPSRKSVVCLALSTPFSATGCYSAQSLMLHVCEAQLTHLADQVSVRSVV